MDVAITKGDLGGYDWDLNAEGTDLLMTGDEIGNSFLTSMLTDSKIDADSDVEYLGGWWGDTIELTFETGSKLWHYESTTMTSDRIKEIPHRIKEAIVWMIDDGVIDDVKSQVTQIDGGINVVVELIKSNHIIYKYQDIWSARCGKK